MTDVDTKLLLGLWRTMIPLPVRVWKAQVSKNAQDAQGNLGFMSEEHHRVRDLAVLELPRAGEPLSPAYIARELELPRDRVQVILDELEMNMTFLYRGDGESVTWAYPVTVDETPHRVAYSSGEQGYAA